MAAPKRELTAGELRDLILNEGVKYPTRRDSQLIGGALANRASLHAVTGPGQGLR